MDFSFTPEQDVLRSQLRQMLDDVCPLRYAEQCNNEGRPPCEAYEALVDRIAWLMDRGKAKRNDAAVLKLSTGEAYKAVYDMRLQIMGGYGYCMDYPMQRFFRDSRFAVIDAGTSEIKRNIIARGLGL